MLYKSSHNPLNNLKAEFIQENIFIYASLSEDNQVCYAKNTLVLNCYWSRDQMIPISQNDGVKKKS